MLCKVVPHWLGLFLSLQMESMAQTLYIMYFVSITTLLFGSLGLFGAIKGKQWALIMVGKPAAPIASVRVNGQQSDSCCPHTGVCVSSSLQLEWSSSASSWPHVRYQRWFFDHRYYKAYYKVFDITMKSKTSFTMGAIKAGRIAVSLLVLSHRWWRA